jgi:hypothetical protein
VHGPTPRSYAQRTPKKMKAAALRGALSDRAQNGRVHVVSGFVTGEAPSTKSALGALDALVSSRHVLVVAERSDLLTWRSLRNVPRVHLLAPDQLNTYDVLVSDDVVFTQGGYDAFVARASGGPVSEESGSEEPVSEQPVSEPATDAGSTAPAAADESAEELEVEVARNTDKNLLAETANEAAGADAPAANELDEEGEGK